MIYIIIEEAYETNNRVAMLMDGILSTVQKKNDVYICKESDRLPQNAKVAVVIFSSLKWAVTVGHHLHERGIYPIIFGFQHLEMVFNYGCVTPTYTKSTYLLTKYLLSKKKGKTAFLGYNPDSLPDKLKLMGIKYAVKEAGCSYEVFYNYGDADACLRDFVDRCHDIDNIVCSNDCLAVMLVNDYPQVLENRAMCCCNGTRVSEYLNVQYPTAKVDYRQAGVQAAILYKFADKYESIRKTSVSITSSMTICFCDGEFSVYEQPGVGQLLYSAATVDFYRDKSVEEVERLDCMITNCDDIDFEILHEIIEGASNEKIAERLYLAPNTVKYRLNKIFNNADVATKKELCELVERYKLHL